MFKDTETIKVILAEALEKQTEAERSAYLREVCRGDGRLQAEVESLLQAHQEAGEFLEGGACGFDVGTEQSLLSEGPGTIIGSYRLVEKMGEGGFGVVYLADQESPIRRQVALKIIKFGMDTRRVIARFEAERQALALMDHPHIAKVLDAGATETGRPYFVMEVVRGTSITAYCDEQQLAIRERLELFVSVCQAVQHAHQKGIIHRDIKPSNVLVTRQDDKPCVKVIDFGVAKAIHQRLTEKTMVTRHAQIIGTPSYMSPEQADMGRVDIDTRTDIYSLGVLLYELLTGSTPFALEDQPEVGYVEMQRIVREQDPTKPSTKIRIHDTGGVPVAANRQSTPALLIKRLRGDLDWVTMKALEKDRQRRYATASELARDIERHLGNEPVTAGPPHATYLVSKFIRRHRAVVSLVTLLSVVTISMAWFSRQHAIAEWERRRLALTDAFIMLSRQVYDYESQEQAPEVYAQETLATMNSLAGEFPELSLNLANLADRFGEQQPHAFMNPVAHAYWDLASTLREDLVTATPNSPFYLHTFGRSLVKYPVQYHRDPHRAVTVIRQAVQLEPEEPFYWQTLGEAYYQTGDYTQAVTAFEKEYALTGSVNHHSVLRLILSYWQLGREAEAEVWYARAEQWRRDHPAQQMHQIQLQIWAQSLLSGAFLTVDDFEGGDQGGWVLCPGASGSIRHTISPGFEDEDPQRFKMAAFSPILRSPMQTLELSFDNRGINPYEAYRSWDTPQDWQTLGCQVLSLQVRGFAASPGGFELSPEGTVIVSGGGGDIVGRRDQFHFAYQILEGPGTITARIDQFTQHYGLAKAGLMIRESLVADAQHACVYLQPNSEVYAWYRGGLENDRAEFDAYRYSDRLKGVTPPCWLRLERDDENIFTVSYSRDGQQWLSIPGCPPKFIAMRPDVYVGLAVTTLSTTQAETVVFSQLALEGNVGGDWQHEDVGVPGNGAEPLYVSVTDTYGNRAEVYHPDPRAAQRETWCEWLVPLAALREQGVDLTQVIRLGIGLGKSTLNTESGSTGRIYIDDIRLYTRERNTLDEGS